MTPNQFIEELGEAVTHNSLPQFFRKCKTDREYASWAEKLTSTIKVYERKATNHIGRFHPSMVG